MSPTYLSFCIEMALKRPNEYVPTRLAYLILTTPKSDKVRGMLNG